MTIPTLANATVSRAIIQVPAWGAWWASVDTADDASLAAGDAATLVAAGVSWSGTVVSGGTAEGRGAYRLVGGRGGWGREVPARSYADDSGVRVSVVLEDLARVVGETVSGAPTTRRGPHYARSAGLASATLTELLGRAWYVGPDGVTYPSPRAATTYSGDATRVRVDPALGVVELAVDDASGLAPGVSVDGTAPATDIEIEIGEGRTTVRVYYAPTATRRMAALARLVDVLDPRRRYRGVYEYRVVSQSGDRLSLQPVRAASGLGDLERVPVRLAPGVMAQHLPGSTVLVAFADCDPSRPCVVSGDAAGAPGWMPVTLTLGAAPVLGVARQTDPVIAGPFAGTITLGSVRVRAG